MGVPGQKQLMMDENLVWWADQVRSAILSVDSTALVGMGFLWPKGPNLARAGDPRVVRARPVIDSSALDFFDIHLHPGLELTFPQYMENYELTTPAVKPVVLGEFGGFKVAYPTAGDAEWGLRGVQAASCGYGVDGWLHWSWNTTEFGAGERVLWNGDAANGIIDHGLGALLRPDPCAPVPGAGNIALGKPVTASATEAGSSPTRAVDGLNSTFWNSGAYPTQWIEIDLLTPVSIGRARLFVLQSPDGATTHRIYTRATTGDPWDPPDLIRRVGPSTTRCSNTPSEPLDERPLRARRNQCERLLGRLERDRALCPVRSPSEPRVPRSGIARSPCLGDLWVSEK